jgi:hypothetical protein
MAVLVKQGKKVVVGVAVDGLPIVFEEQDLI